PVYLKPGGIIYIPQELQLGNGSQPLRASGITGDEDQIFVLYPGSRPVKIIVQVCRLVIFVNAKEADVEVISWVGEIVSITSKEGRVELRRKNQSHVGVFFVLVE